MMMTNAQLMTENERLRVALRETKEQQAATSEILRVIGDSPTDAQPVFDAIVRHAARLCDAAFSGVALADGEHLTLPAAHGLEAADLETFLAPFPIRLGPDTVSGRAILEGRVVHVRDQAAEPSYAGNPGQRVGTRSIVAVPMLRSGRPIGAISAWRREVRPFTDAQIELLQTFADQAVIAIENVRLFTELQEKNRALTEAHRQVTETLEQQTATSQILRVISSSPTDVEPVFETILASTNRLCEASFSVLFLSDGEVLRAAAYENVSPTLAEQLRTARVRPRRGGSPVALTALERVVVHVPDVLTDSRFSPADVPSHRTEGARSILSVPMLREGNLVGVINTWRLEPRAFTDKQIELLKTFAEQAVIAIENVRLFTELQGKNRALTEAHTQVTEALEQQTAASEILRVISSSPTDVQPVLDTVAASAARLCGAYDASVFRVDGERLRLAAHHGSIPAGNVGELTLSIAPGSVNGRSIIKRRPIHVPDVVVAGDEFPEGAAFGRELGFRTQIAVPMIREGAAIGTIALRRTEVMPFSDKQIDLLKTFADQAVIAIENVRLFTELQARTEQLTRSVDKLTALGEVSRALSTTLDLETVLSTIVARANQLAGADGGSVYEYDEQSEAFHLRATDTLDDEVVVMARRTPVPRSEGVLGRMAVTREPVQIPDIAQEGAYRSPLRDVLLRTGTRALLAVPLLREDHLIGGLTVNKKTPGEFSPEVIDLLKTFASQSALAIQNARLFREIADKSRQLEAASQHKSEFLANMSHELRTPLNAIIGFSEVLTERMFGELNEKQDEYLKDIYASGQHLLSLINDILDLSKIEAGRMELEPADFDLPTAIENALILVRERASRRGITLARAIEERLGMIRADERKVKQVLLNLLSNALKFTPEGGRIDVRAGLAGDVAEISVTDTGVGIAAEDQEAIFEEFQQVGTAAKKLEGTGLGLALSRKFIELHRGRIWVKSQVGAGSTFTFTIPVRRGE